MRPIALIATAATSLLLAACGGGGGAGDIASAPPPVPTPTPTPSTPALGTPLPPTPATTTGTYQAFSTFLASDASNAEKMTLPDGRQVYVGTEIIEPLQLAPQGSVRISVDAATRTYTVTADVGPFQFPTEPMPMTMSATSDLGYSRNYPIFGQPDQMTPQARSERGDLVSRTIQAGTTASGAPRLYTSFVTLYNVGQQDGSPRYLSAAQWGKLYQENASGILEPGQVRPLQAVSGIMVFGSRTESADIPASGSARYSLASLVSRTQDDIGYYHALDLETVLDIDFATRRLSATYDQSQTFDDYELDDEGYAVLDDEGNAKVIGRIDTNVHATGSTIVANDGGFGIELAGMGTVRTVRTDQPPVADIANPVSGSLTGAFFGPQAAEVGGIAILPLIGTDGEIYTSTDIFAGQRTSP